ncbi:hypothetical protein D7Z96_05590 [Pseudarthrobacter phenanthrenivorans]|uniref:Uncharacterized protein n=2 Tax=Pseudarthrobacter phenanthrenivorans TaxID=361575 RepID=A0A3B0FMQ7_PSEPS|nr:hypothetical protein [Pseudarthrobacter phenanthrenivorans]ADX72299.1 hypothetical protein Asphe3_11170 [Pseudarthrobacter phenanthrenivorans Sphe3]RKO26204.1 hypothetical protein D7Z96_05590 [Pseudarthrobacter phenanthrenivorans]TPV48640.1 hypothetical protein FJ661_18490 [Pseudarthrobacter phenanthrenivorans]
MEILKKIVSNQYFPAGAVLGAVLLFWAVGLLGGLSLLHNNQPPLTTLTWMLFVYMAAVLTPLAGIAAAVDLVRRWRRNRAAEAAPAEANSEPAGGEAYSEPSAALPPAAQAPQAPQPKKNHKQPGRKQAA